MGVQASPSPGDIAWFRVPGRCPDGCSCGFSASPNRASVTALATASRKPATATGARPGPGRVAEEQHADEGRRQRLREDDRRGRDGHAAALERGGVEDERHDARRRDRVRRRVAQQGKRREAVEHPGRDADQRRSRSPRSCRAPGCAPGRAAAARRSARHRPSAAVATISAILKAPPAVLAPSAPADEPSSPTPATTPPTASHSRSDSVAPMITVARTAITARLAATIAWTANSGSRCSATSCAMKPSRSMNMLTTNRHWCSMRGTRPASSAARAAWACDRLLASRTATACMTEATP